MDARFPECARRWSDGSTRISGGLEHAPRTIATLNDAGSCNDSAAWTVFPFCIEHFPVHGAQAPNSLDRGSARGSEPHDTRRV